MSSYLITGSSRGLGLQIVTELLKTPSSKVIATARNTKKSAGLQDLAAQYPTDRLVLVDLDVTSETSIAAAVEAVSKILPGGLDHLISNAGVNDLALIPFEEVDLTLFKEEIDFSLISTILLLRGFLPLVKKSSTKKIIQISSVLGSVELAGYMPGLTPTYSVGKAALNMLIRKWGASLKNEGVTTLLAHPGWVKATDIGGAIAEWMEKYAPETKSVTPEEAAAGVVKVLNEKTFEDSGSFFNYDGTKLPW
ncbi:putative short-chain dehydrogenases/ reductase [Rhypophila decipiens]|uniref:Short-chain dehydrogenases/ reductase n=1 Tax=Rhypophila decipiens TaxID=261697 RepID=A0AAN7B5F6_9PEZI|nr:putative short-chain dehydrogenases/ reductase [Rhypophila decipiens]